MIWAYVLPRGQHAKQIFYSWRNSCRTIAGKLLCGYHTSENAVHLLTFLEYIWNQSNILIIPTDSLTEHQERLDIIFYVQMEKRHSPLWVKIGGILANQSVESVLYTIYKSVLNTWIEIRNKQLQFTRRLSQLYILVWQLLCWKDMDQNIVHWLLPYNCLFSWIMVNELHISLSDPTKESQGAIKFMNCVATLMTKSKTKFFIEYHSSCLESKDPAVSHYFQKQVHLLFKPEDILGLFIWISVCWTL